MNKQNPKVLVVATSRKTRGGITSVVKAHETGEQWNKYKCKWIESHRDGGYIRKLWYLTNALIKYFFLLPFYDIVHIHVGAEASVPRKTIFAAICRIYKKKLIIHFHPSSEILLFEQKHSKGIKNLFSYSDLLIVLAPQWVKYIDKAFPDNKFNIKVLYNPCPKAIRSIAKKENNILFAGAIRERKGYNRLLEAFAKIAHKYPAWKLVFAGNGEIEKAQELAAELNINKQTKFLGWVSGKDKEDAFHKASIYCLPSWGEGFPMGVIDAWAYGIPVVTTPVGGIVDIIEHGINGLIFDVYNTDELASCLEKLIISESNRNRIIKEADKLVNNEFNIKQIAKELDKIYSTFK